MPHRHAYLIIAHNEPQVLRYLLTCLDYPGNDIYLHIDAWAKEMNREFAQWKPLYAGFQMAKDPLHAGWGGYNMIRVEMMLFEWAHKNGPYMRYHVMSGVDLPIKSQQAIHQFFSEHTQREYVSFWETPEHQRDLKRKTRYYYLFNEHLKDKGTWKYQLGTPIRKIALMLQKICFTKRYPNIEFKKGSVWVSITEDFCSYLTSRREHVLRTYKRMLCADEIFLQTELWNSSLRKNVTLTGDLVEESLRLIDWERGKPYVWKNEDLQELLDSTALFARKCTGTEIRLMEELAAHGCTNQS